MTVLKRPQPIGRSHTSGHGVPRVCRALGIVLTQHCQAIFAKVIDRSG